VSLYYIIYRGISSSLNSSALSDHLALKKKNKLNYFFIIIHRHFLYILAFFCEVVLSGRVLDAIFSIFCQTFFFILYFHSPFFIFYFFFLSQLISTEMFPLLYCDYFYLILNKLLSLHLGTFYFNDL